MLDAGLAKSFRVHGDRHRVTFRLEAFNALNHANYDFPENNISNRNTVATISDITKPMRQVQFALRYDF